jgi:uncharacterized protein YuzE
MSAWSSRRFSIAMHQSQAGRTMKVNFDKESNALYIRFSDEKIEDTAEVRPGVMMDYDAKGRIVGLEILNASEALSGPDMKRLAVEVG